MIAASGAARRKAARLVRIGLPGVVVLLVLAVTVAVFVSSRPAVAARRGTAGDSWVTSWSASPQVAGRESGAAVGFDDQTIRETIFTSIGGDPIRLEVSNVYGTSPLWVGRVTVAVAGQGAAVQPGTIQPVTFGGSASFRIQAGTQILSDPVAMWVQPLQDLAVSIYLPGQTGAATVHTWAQEVNWVSTPGDHAAEEGAGAFGVPTRSWYYVSDLLVRSPGAAGTVVALGDSITDGVGSTVGADARWPNDLARRLDALGGPPLAVADQGIGGNRVLTGAGCCGVSAEARFEPDALDQPGVRDIIVLEGINDIGFTSRLPDPRAHIGAAQIIAGYQRLITQAHARGLKIFGATLLPFQGAWTYTAAAEATREVVNTWIRTSGAFDGVIDFDAAVRDPADPLRLDPGYDSGDHLHPNDAGYQAMADAIDLAMLQPGRPGAGP
jgi:lysophospholipase L1-like esterase